MSIMERLDLLAAGLPRTCLFCRHGQPMVWSMERWLDVFGCSRHMVDGLKSKRLTLALDRMHPNREGRASGVAYAPMLAADEGCGDWEPVAVGSRKFKLLDLFGMLEGGGDGFGGCEKGI